MSLLLILPMAADVPERPARTDGYGPVRFGMRAEHVLRLLGAPAVLEEVCGGRRAVTFGGRDGARVYTAMAHVEHGRVVDIELFVHGRDATDTREQCLSDFDRVLALQQTRYRGYELLIEGGGSGWTREKSARLRFADGSAVSVRSKYWVAGGTCYTYVTHLPPAGVQIASR
ncbi:MAG: hypothetical protein ACE5LB_14065 [Acidiferrobacterales bacterium]